jgi:hypothetical protein
MTTGPIEFLSDGVIREVPESEFGGADGLIQPAKDVEMPSAPEAQGGHSDEALYEHERNSMAARYGTVALSVREAITGEPDTPDVMFDPATGRQLPVEWSEDGLSAKPSDLKPL